MKKNRITDIICLTSVALVFVSVVLLNLFQKDRPTESASEKRKLAEMPEITVTSLTDGSYFSGVTAFISDTFIGRDRLVELSKRIDTLKGVDYSIGGEDSFVLLSPIESRSEDAEDHSALSEMLSEALDMLEKKDEIETADSSVNIPGTVAELDVSYISDETEIPEETNIADDTAIPDETEIPDEPDVPAETDETPAAEPKGVTAIHLSRTSLSLTVGSGSVVNATVESDLDDGAMVKWGISDKTIATISVNEGGGINVKGLKPGEVILTCSYGDDLRETCKVKVTEVTEVTEVNNDEHADFLASGLFIYGDAVYTQAWYNESASAVYAQTAEYYKKLFGENTRVSVVTAPVSSMVVDNPEVRNKVQDMDTMIQKIGSHFSDQINFVNPCSEMYDHKNEYLFFKSDHHWTQRGAYYAYSAFAKSIGIEPTPLDDFNYDIRNDNYSGSLYSWTNDARVKNFRDTVEVFESKKGCTMTVTSSNGATYNYDTSIVRTNKTYVTFIAGDNPYTVINVPENPQDKSILVFKDSFGNAFVPFLCEHYGNIIVVDVRYSKFNVYEQLKDYGLSDIVFVNNVQAVTSSWAKMYLAAVGVN